MERKADVFWAIGGQKPNDQDLALFKEAITAEVEDKYIIFFDQTSDVKIISDYEQLKNKRELDNMYVQLRKVVQETYMRDKTKFKGTTFFSLTRPNKRRSYTSAAAQIRTGDPAIPDVGGTPQYKKPWNPDIPIRSTVGQSSMNLSNLENKDIQKSAALGDQIVASKQSRDVTTDTLRTHYNEIEGSDVIQTPHDYMDSDIRFDMFSWVQPGSGLGVNNKMFLMEEARRRFIDEHEPLSQPRNWDGPTNGIIDPPMMFQNTMSSDFILSINQEKERDAVLQRDFIRVQGPSSTNILGDDYGYLFPRSMKGLIRTSDIVYEPIVQKPSPMHPVKWLTTDRKSFRRIWDPMRYPEHNVVQVAQEGGPTMSKYLILTQPLN